MPDSTVQGGSAVRVCRVCAAPVESVLSLGRMPIANGFLRPAEFSTEYFFELAVGCCHRCRLVQLTEMIDPERLFHSQYAYFSSLSQGMCRHFAHFASEVGARVANRHNPFVVEIGSNDGILLHHVAEAGIRHLGIEPSTNVAAVARNRGVHTVSRFFDEQTALDLRQAHGPADIILGANVICHVGDLHAVLRGVAALLRDDGLFVFEDPYLGEILANTSYDQIYAEHAYYFSLQAIEVLVAQHEMEVCEVHPQPTHGGSMRYVVARRGVRTIDPAVDALRLHEQSVGVSNSTALRAFRERVEQSRENLVGLLEELQRTGKRVAGYGATAKSTTVTMYCGIGPHHLEFISDTTPGKQGLYSPGMHIPVVSPAHFADRYPDYAVMFAWNHREEIRAKEAGGFLRAGGRFVEYVPTVHVTS